MPWIFAFFLSLFLGQGIPFPGFGPPAAAGGTFAKTHIVSSSGCATNTNTCAITVAATVAGRIGVIMAGLPNGNGSISSISGAGTWASPAGCDAYWSAHGQSVACAYNLSETSGATTITVTWSTSSPGLSVGFTYFEYSYSGASVSYDTSGNRAETVSGNPRNGVTLTLSGTNDVIVQSQIWISASSVGSPYGNFTAFAGSTGDAADNENTASGTAPSWTYSANQTPQFNGVALKGN